MRMGRLVVLPELNQASSPAPPARGRGSRRASFPRASAPQKKIATPPYLFDAHRLPSLLAAPSRPRFVARGAPECPAAPGSPCVSSPLRSFHRATLVSVHASRTHLPSASPRRSSSVSGLLFLRPIRASEGTLDASTSPTRLRRRSSAYTTRARRSRPARRTIQRDLPPVRDEPTHRAIERAALETLRRLRQHDPLRGRLDRLGREAPAARRRPERRHPTPERAHRRRTYASPSGSFVAIDPSRSAAACVTTPPP